MQRKASRKMIKNMYISVEDVLTILSGMLPMSTFLKVKKKLMRRADPRAADVILCKDCRWARKTSGGIYCAKANGLLDIDYVSFCSMGEKEDKDNDN